MILSVVFYEKKIILYEKNVKLLKNNTFNNVFRDRILLTRFLSIFKNDWIFINDG